MRKSVGNVLLWFGVFNLVVSISLLAMGMTTGKFVGVPGMVAWSVIMTILGVVLRDSEEPAKVKVSQAPSKPLGRAETSS